MDPTPPLPPRHASDYSVDDIRDKADNESSSISVEEDVDFTFEKHTMRRVDRRLLPILGCIYAVALIDRVNIGVARITGADHALHLSIGPRYTIVTVIFFVPYILLELPSNILLRRVSPALWLSSITVLWGVVMLCMGFVKTWGQLAILRFLLGMLEAGSLPGCAYLISVWYTRRELQTRMAAFYVFSLLCTGFSSILSYGFYLMDGLADIAGWRWIFIMSGILTCVLGITAYFTIVDFPDQNKFLTPAQTALVRARVQSDRGDAEPDTLTWHKAIEYARDLKIWAFGLVFLAASTPIYAFAYFLPSIIQSFGYETREVMLLCAPPFGFSTITALSVAYWSDRLTLRSPFIIAQALVTAMGFLLIAYCSQTSARYVGVFFGVAGVSGNLPAILAYQANNIVGQSKRAFSSALVIGLGGVGGIIAGTVYRQQDAPRYMNGMWVVIGLQLFIVVVVGITTLFFHRANEAVRKGTRKEYIEGQPGFLYTL